jgi:hypothetical protein
MKSTRSNGGSRCFRLIVRFQSMRAMWGAVAVVEVPAQAAPAMGRMLDLLPAVGAAAAR